MEGSEVAEHAEEKTQHDQTSMKNWKRWALTSGAIVTAVVVAVTVPAVVVKRSNSDSAPVRSRTSGAVSDDTASTFEPTLSPTTHPPPSVSPTLHSSQAYTAGHERTSNSTPTHQPTARVAASQTPETSPSTTSLPLQGPTPAPSLQPPATPTRVDTETATRQIVSLLNLQQFKDNIKTLSDFGDRTQGTTSYIRAEAWVRTELERYGYTVKEHAYFFRGSPRTNLYVTKVGMKFPDQMYIVSAHLDGRGSGGAANDDGSGCSLVLEMARVMATAGANVETSIRFIFWNNEETGLNGAASYVSERKSIQGAEDPAGSGQYPEPKWLGVVTHDQILFDHGLPMQEDQIAAADSDIEYQSNSAFASQSLALANLLHAGNEKYADTYPSEVSGDMCCTDSVPFQDVCPSVSIRENRRRAEIGNGAQPHWHQPTDLFSTYSEKDFLFGFNVVQTTVGTICELSGLTLEKS